MSNIRKEFFPQQLSGPTRIIYELEEFPLTPDWGTGSFLVCKITPGMYLCHNRIHVRKLIENRTHPSFPGPVFKFDYCLEGQARISGIDGLSISPESGYAIYFAGEQNFGSADFGRNPYSSISLFCYVDEIANSLEQFLGVPRDRVYRLYRTLSANKPFLSRMSVCTRQSLDSVLELIKNRDVALLRIRVMEFFLREMHVLSFCHAGPPVNLVARETVRKIRAIKKEMDENPGLHRTIQELARQYYIGETNLKNSFREMYSIGIYSYLRQIRMQRAACLLQNTDCSVLSIANQLGYLNPGKFAAAFKRTYGTTPLRFRKDAYRLAG